MKRENDSMEAEIVYPDDYDPIVEGRLDAKIVLTTAQVARLITTLEKFLRDGEGKVEMADLDDSIWIEVEDNHDE